MKWWRRSWTAVVRGSERVPSLRDSYRCASFPALPCRAFTYRRYAAEASLYPTDPLGISTYADGLELFSLAGRAALPEQASSLPSTLPPLHSSARPAQNNL